jgi:TPP-dependent pyruvate/acetoin dehydrogenase alpha subunit
MALAEKEQSTGKIVLVFIGDGTLGEGALYESLNIAALWKLPILFVLEDNRFAQTTPVNKGVAGSMSERFGAFGIPVWEIDTTDILDIQLIAGKAVQAVRSGTEPASLILHTYRFSAHSKGDDPRSQEELDSIRKFDPLKVHGARLPTNDLENAEAEVAEIINDAFVRAGADPFPILSVESNTLPVGQSMVDN